MIIYYIKINYTIYMLFKNVFNRMENILWYILYNYEYDILYSNDYDILYYKYIKIM